jgi:hydroxymethylbilane synthase
VVRLVAQLDDPQARLIATAERTVLAAMHGGCSIPLGVYAQCRAQEVFIDAMISDMQGKHYLRRAAHGAQTDVEAVATQVAQELLEAGGRDILAAIRSGDDGKK